MPFRSSFPEKKSVGLALLVASLGLGILEPTPLRGEAREIASANSETACRFLRVGGRRDDGRPRFWRLSATDILDLELNVGLPFGLEGEHRVDVKLYTPDDHLYRSLTVLVRDDETGASPSPTRKKLADLERPVDVQRSELTRLRRAPRVRISLPVAGTAIVTSSLYGRWTAIAYLDGNSKACTEPRTFLLTE